MRVSYILSIVILCIGEGNGNPLQYSCLENFRDGQTWWAAVYGVTQSQTQLKRLSSSSSKQGDKIQPWCTPFLIWKQSVVPYPVLTVASWPTYRFLKRQDRWSGIPISWRIFQSLLWSCGHCWVFQICWHTECSTFTASSFRIWNSSTGIPSPPLVVMLPKALLTSHSRMSGSRWVWVITPSWLSRLWRSFLYSSATSS